jgi:geranylgeranylglycerol-phosphate geranylgeranyltransferase
MSILPHKHLYTYLTITRPKNIILGAAATALGFWLGHSPYGYHSLLLMVIATVCATAWGNVINDIRDIVSDRISHPHRPLAAGKMSTASAALYAAILSVTAVVAGFGVSPLHGGATLIPLVLLTIYTFFLKSTPLTGNILVSLLVAYCIVYGGLGAPQLYRLSIPALLALLLNLIREIVKDYQDSEGDTHAGYTTTAIIPAHAARIVVTTLSALYLVCVPLPFLLGHFGTVYLLVCLAGVIPAHLRWLLVLLRTPWNSRTLSTGVSWVKFEMLLGLAALAADELAHVIPW